MTSTRSGAIAGVLGALFVVGFALMGFEMLGSRYLNPYFGGGITTWASLISVVLFAMMVGYFAGGHAVDRRPGVDLLAICTALAGLSMMMVPPLADATLQLILQTLGDGFWGVLTASLFLSFVPVALLSACSPFAVRLLLVDLKAGGKTAGLVYSISTFGNVMGTLGTTFFLIPNYGTRAITYTFGVALVVLAALLYLSKRGIERGLVTKAMAALVACWLCTGPVAAEEGPLARWEASYPEGPIWLGDRLLYAEMPLHRVMEWKDGQRRLFWNEPDCGPTAIAPYRGDGFIVLCHLAGKIVELDKDGRTVRDFAAADNGERLQDPNDCFSDGRGGVFFSDSGTFRMGAPATGKVFRIDDSGRITKIVDRLAYANGVAFDAKARRLLVSEHLARKVWQYTLREDFSVASSAVFLDVGKHFAPAEIDFPETGPDGIEFDDAGNTYIPVYGAGHVMVVGPKGEVKKIAVAMKFVTNVAASGSRIVIVGAFMNDRPPFPGRVEMWSRADFLSKGNGNAGARR